MIYSCLIRKWLLLILSVLIPISLVAQVSVLTQHNDVGRTGWNSQETTLNVNNVNASSFGKLFSRSVDGYVYAQPLYVSNVSLNGTRNIVIVATEHNSVYAFDADDPNASSPLWQVNLGPSVDSQDVCNPPISDCPYVDLVPEIGITSTPVIDTSTNTIYAIAKTKDTSASYHFRLHALDLFSGAEKFGGPSEIADVADGFDPFIHNNRAGLLLLNGVIYSAFGSVGDYKIWHGWVFAHDAQTLVQRAVLNVTPVNNSLPGGGIWQAGQGLLSDGSGNVFLITSNGFFDGVSNFGDSFVKLQLNGSNLTVADYYTPANQGNLGLHNVDLGAGGPLLIPGTHLIVGGGKDGMLRLVDTTNMGQYNGVSETDVQNWQAINTNSIMMGSPAFFNSPTLGPVVYMWGPNDNLNAWHFNGATFDTATPASVSSIISPDGEANTVALSVSSNGSNAGTGILWTSGPASGDANESTQPGIFRAFDASNLQNEIWDSSLNMSRDDVGFYAKFNPPTIANGKVYLGTFADPSLSSPPYTSHLLVYGLLNPPDFGLSPSPSGASVTAGQSASFTITASPQSGFNGSVSFSCSGLPGGAACSFNPPSVTVTGNTASTTMTITTTARSSGSLRQSNGKQLPLYAILLPIPGLALFGAGFGSRRRNRKLIACLFGAMLLSLLLLQVACGGGGSGSGGGSTGGTPSGTYTVIVTGTSGRATHNSQVNLTVE